MDQLGHLVLLVLLDSPDLQALQALRGILVQLAIQVLLDHLEILVSPVQVGSLDNLDHQAQLVTLVQADRLETAALQVCLAAKGHLDLTVHQALQGLQDRKVRPEHLVLPVLTAKLVIQAHKVNKVLKVQQGHLASLGHQVRGDLLVILVQQVLMVLRDYKAQRAMLGHQDRQGQQDRLVPKEMLVL